MTFPSGTVTFLFTDVEGSTRLWEAQPDAMRAALEDHDRLVRRAIEDAGGYVFATAGDSFAAAFADAANAVDAAVAMQHALTAYHWPTTEPIRVRCGIHRGPAHERGGDYFGPPLNRTARLMAIAHGGQVLLSQSIAGALGDGLAENISFRDLGRHRLKDLEVAEHVFQVEYPGLADFPPLRSLGSFANNLPVQISSFVGREQDRADVAAALSSARLVTLVGPGGAGKTRLATHVAADLLESFAAGVWFVDLAVLTEPKLVANAVADAMGLEDSSGDVQASLGDALGRGPTLVVMDNCEHLVAAAASLVEELLTAAPELRVMATSREGLQVPGETRYRVQPMALPKSAPPDELLELDAVQLFAERAAQAEPGFAVEPGNVDLVAEVCRHLDGLPLAIELAAARVGHLSLDDIAARLDDRFALLTRGARTAAARQQTLQAAVDWSHELLDSQQKVCFRRLAVFAGSFGLESAEQVAGFDGIARTAVLDLLAALVDRSLVRSEADEDGRRRYRLLETLREYAAHKLDEAGETDAGHRRHVDHFVALASAFKEGMRGPESARWHDRLAAELDEMRAVLQRSIAAGDLEAAAAVASGCWFHWYVRGHWDEGYRWLSRIEELGRDLDPELMADVLRGLGGIATAMHRLDVGTASLEREIEIRTELGQRSPLAAALLNLANAQALDGRYAESVALYERSLEISKELGEEISSVMSNLAWTALDMGDYELARDRFAETLELARSEGERRNEAWGHLGLGVVAWLRRDFGTAIESLEAARTLFVEYQERPMVAFCRTFEAKTARDSGDREAAVELLRELAGELAALDDPGGVTRWLTTASVVVCGDGRPEEAAQLLGGVGDHDELPPWERLEVEHVVEELVKVLGRDGFESACAVGAAADPVELMRAAFTA